MTFIRFAARGHLDVRPAIYPPESIVRGGSDTVSQPEPMCEIALRPTMVYLFPQLKSSFTVYGVTLPSPLLAALGYAPPTLGTWPRFFFSLVSPPKVNLIPDRGVGAKSGHANNDVKPCIGTFEIKTPNRRKE